MTLGKADPMIIHSSVTVTSSDCAHENSVPLNDAMGRLEKASMEVECPFSNGFCTDEPSMALGNVETKSDRASIGLFQSLSRAGIVDLGFQDGDEGG